MEEKIWATWKRSKNNLPDGTPVVTYTLGTIPRHVIVESVKGRRKALVMQKNRIEDDGVTVKHFHDTVDVVYYNTVKEARIAAQRWLRQ